MAKVKKYQWGTFSASGATPQMINPGNAALKQYTTTSSSSIPDGSLPTSGDISQVAYSKDKLKGPSFKDKAGAFMGNYGGAITSAAGSLMPLLMKKPDPNAKPYKKGSKLIKYQAGTKSLTKEEGKVGKGSEYFSQAKTLNSQEKTAFRKLDAEAKQKGMTFEYKGLKYDPTNPVNLTTPTRTSNSGITYSSGTAPQSNTQSTAPQAPAKSLITDSTTTTQQPAKTPRKIVGKVDAKTGYSIYPNGRVYSPKTQVMGKLDAKGNINWDNGQKETITPATAAASVTTPTTAIAKNTTPNKESGNTNEDRALNADLISIGLDMGSILSPEPFSAGGMAAGSQIAANTARTLRNESVGLGTHAWETLGTAISAVPLVGDYARAGNVMKTIGRVIKSPATRKILTGVGAAGVGLGGEQALNNLNEVYQKYEKEGITSLGKDDMRKVLETVRLMTNATQVAKNVSRTVKNKVTIDAKNLAEPLPEVTSIKPEKTKKVLKSFTTDKGNTVMKEVEVPLKDPKWIRRDTELRNLNRQKTLEKNKPAGLKKQEEFSKEFEKKTGYKTKAEMRQAEEAKAAKAKERRRTDYKTEKAIQKEKQEALQQDYEKKLIKFSQDVTSTKEAVKKNFKAKQAAKKFQAENTPPELVVMRKMGDKTPSPIKMTPSQRLLPEGPEQITSKESQAVINKINERIRTSPNKTKAELEIENAALKAERESRQAPIVYKSELPSDQVKGLLPEPADLKAARLAAEEKQLIKYAEEVAKADIAATMVKPKTQKIKISRKLYNMGRARGKGGVRRQD
jgi:hypothetical protein